MRQFYDPYVLQKFAEGRVFFVNAKMPFEYFIDCFQYEHPFFLVAKLDDGRIAITPNALVIPKFFWRKPGFDQFDWLPTGYEYVTMSKGTYPVFITAHPIDNIDLWFRKFEMCVEPFCKQTLWDFVSRTFEFEPIKYKTKTRTEVPEEALT